MCESLVEVKICALAPVSDGSALFLGNEEKVFLIRVDQSAGAALMMFIQGTQSERPLNHDLLENILRAFGAKIESVIINDLQRDTYFARLVLSAENEVHEKKIIAIDARPSVSLDVWSRVENLTGASTTGRRNRFRFAHGRERGGRGTVNLKVADYIQPGQRRLSSQSSCPICASHGVSEGIRQNCS
jgi:bifunctional DNase/RNase